jgi:hypothetical protein|tara:strand:- start:15581 stop:16177 length:597 start_codon:yes stop_codon:yes gene_type:complete
MKATEMLSQIKTLLRARIGLAQMTLEDGETVIEADALEAGQAVFIVSDDERIALPVGEYTTADGQIVVVAEEGTIAEVKDAMEVEKMEDKEDEEKKEELEEVVVEDVPEIAAEEVAAIVEAVVEVVAPVLEEVKEQVEELYKKFEDQEDKKEKMSSQKPARKPMKHNPEAKQTVKQNLYSQGANFNTTKDRVFSKLFK